VIRLEVEVQKVSHKLGLSDIELVAHIRPLRKLLIERLEWLELVVVLLL
jgi:hypothetical protein